MSTAALTMMLVTQITVICITGFFFYKVLTTKPKSKPDLYSENDNEPR